MVGRPKQRGGRYRATPTLTQPTLETLIKVTARATNITKRKQYSLGYRLAAPVWPVLHKLLWNTLQLLLVTQAKRARKGKKF